MIYIALLRGINVGGNNKVNMQELARMFETVGMTNVSTYINSGNVLFQHAPAAELKIANVLEEAILKTFGFPVSVVVVSKPSLLAIAEELPDEWVNDATMKCDVMFLWDEVNKPEVIDQLTLKPDIDKVRYVHGALLWAAERRNVTRSGMMKIAGTPLYKKMTIRNSNTLRKLVTLVTAIDD